MSHDLKLVIAVARTYNKMFSQIEGNLKSLGLNPSEFGVLEFLFHKGEQPVQKIADKILVTSGTITYNLNKLEKRGFIEKKKYCSDGRVYYVHLTPLGKAYIQDIFPKHESFLKKLFKDVPTSHQKLLLEELRFFYDHLPNENL